VPNLPEYLPICVSATLHLDKFYKNCCLESIRSIGPNVSVSLKVLKESKEFKCSCSDKENQANSDQTLGEDLIQEFAKLKIVEFNSEDVVFYGKLMEGLFSIMDSSNSLRKLTLLVDGVEYLHDFKLRVTKSNSLNEATLLLQLTTQDLANTEQRITRFIRRNFSKQLEIIVGVTDDDTISNRAYCTYMYCN